MREPTCRSRAGAVSSASAVFVWRHAGLVCGWRYESGCGCRYGSDKPDLRYGLHMATISTAVDGCGFKIFADTVVGGGTVKALIVPEVCPARSHRHSTEASMAEPWSQFDSGTWH